MGFEVIPVRDALDALTFAGHAAPDLVLIDAVSADGAVIDLLERLVGMVPQAPLIVAGIEPDGGLHDRLLRAGCCAVIPRGAGVELVETIIRAALDRGQAPGTRAIAEDLGLALERGEFHLHYQPILDARSGTVAGVEALSRWESPRFGSVPPLRFIPLAEQRDLIGTVDGWAMGEACRQMTRWQRDGVAPGWMAVNVSPLGLRSGDVLDSVRDSLEHDAVPAGTLMLEITEGVLLEETVETSEALDELKEAGVRLAVDDFGTGHAAISYLRRVPFDSLKIDRAFLRGVPDDEQDANLVAAIIHMAHGLGLSVIGEGVETTEQLEFLRDNECDFVQGYLFGEAVPPDRFAARLPNH